MEQKHGMPDGAGDQSPPPSPSQGGSRNQGGVPSPDGSAEDCAELESDPAPAEEDIPGDD